MTYPEKKVESHPWETLHCCCCLGCLLATNRAHRGRLSGPLQLGTLLLSVHRPTDSYPATWKLTEREVCTHCRLPEDRPVRVVARVQPESPPFPQGHGNF